MNDKSLSDTLKQTPMQYIAQGGQEFARFCVEKDSDAEKAIQGLLKQNDIKFSNVESAKAGNTLRFAKEDGQKLEKIIKSIGSAEKAAAIATGSTSPISENEDQQTAEIVSDSTISNENLLKAKEFGADKGNAVEDAIEEIKDRADIKEAKESEKQDILPESAQEKGSKETVQEKSIKLALAEENQKQDEVNRVKEEATLKAILEGKNLAKVDEKAQHFENAANKDEVKQKNKEENKQKEQKKEDKKKDAHHNNPQKAGKKRKFNELSPQEQIAVRKSGRPIPRGKSESKSSNLGKQKENNNLNSNSNSGMNDALRKQNIR